MSRFLSPSRLILIVALTLTWCGLWNDISFANVVAGAAIAIAISAAGIGTTGEGGVRLVPLAKFCWLLLSDLAQSTVSVAVDSITPHDRTEESIVAVNIGPGGHRHHLLLVVAITVSPGTAVVDADPDSGTLYVHVLYGHWREKTIDHVKKLARLANEALPPSGASRSENGSMTGSNR